MHNISLIRAPTEATWWSCQIFLHASIGPRRRKMANQKQENRPARSIDDWEIETSSPSVTAMSSASPVDQYANKSGGSGYGSGQSDSGKSPLSMSLGFLKNLTEKKNTRGRWSDAEHFHDKV